MGDFRNDLITKTPHITREWVVLYLNDLIDPELFTTFAPRLGIDPAVVEMLAAIKWKFAFEEAIARRDARMRARVREQKQGGSP